MDDSSSSFLFDAAKKQRLSGVDIHYHEQLLRRKLRNKLHMKRRQRRKKQEKPSVGGFNTPPTWPQPSSPSQSSGSTLPKIRRSAERVPIGNQLDVRNESCLYNLNFEGLFRSEPHYRLPGGKWSGGGPFYQFTASQQHIGCGTYTTNVNSSLWSGPVIGVTGVPVGDWPAVVPPGTPSWESVASSADAYQATGRARTRPGNPVASVGQFIIELRDLPSLPFKRGIASAARPLTRAGGKLSNVPRVLVNELLDFRNLGSEYLNVQFGWKPFVKDLQGMYNLWKTLDKRLAQIVRDNGKSIRRKAQLKSESDSTQEKEEFSVPFVNMYSSFGTDGAPPWGSVWTSTTRWSEQVWFSGSYRYYIPDIGSSQWTRRAKLALFGALPTPELVWEVLPWSWLIDWFSNVGDVVSNVSTNAVDNLVSDYAYVMRKVTYEKTAQVCSWSSAVDTLIPHWGIGKQVPAFSGTATSTQKWQIQSRSGGGNPFAVGLQLSALTGHQLAILAALGISRSKVV